MKYCRNCNSKCEDYVKFCRVCGCKLSEIYVENNPTERSINSKKSNKLLLIIPVALILVLLTLGVIFYKPILVKYYIYKGDNANGIDKVNYYISAMKYSDDKKLLDNIYISLKDGDFESNLLLVSDILEAKSYKNLSIKYYLEQVDSAYLRGEYKEAYAYLDKLSNLGYNKLSYANYDKIENKVKESKGTLPTESYTNITEIVTTNGDYIIQDSNVRLLSKLELSNFTTYQLSLARNEIFARHGYVFVQEPYKSYFKTKAWYNTNPSFKGSYGELSDVERNNVETIKELEGLN